MANLESVGPIRYSIEEALLLGGDSIHMSDVLSRLENKDGAPAKPKDQQVNSDQKKE